jgi:hypothetical protein
MHSIITRRLSIRSHDNVLLALLELHNEFANPEPFQKENYSGFAEKGLERKV